MAFNLGSLFFRIIAKTDQLDNAEKKVGKSAGKMSKSFARVGAAIGAALSIETARRALLIAENMLLLDVRLRQVSDSQRQFIRNQQDLLKIANETGQAFGDIVTLFERIKLASKDLGATNDQVIQLTESLNKLGIIGGASSTEINNSLRQLSQAFAGGIVRAEEFNSIVENTPALARAIAEGLNVGVGEMRQMVINGKLLSDDVFNAIISQTEQINERFKKIPRTSSMAWQAVENQASQALKKINEEIDGSSSIASSLDGLADSIQPFVTNVIRGAQLVQAGWQIAMAHIQSAWDVWAARVGKTIDDIIIGFKSIPLALSRDMARAKISIKEGLNEIKLALPDFLKKKRVFRDLIDVSGDKAKLAEIDNQLKDIVQKQGGVSEKQHQANLTRIRTERDETIAAAEQEFVADIQRINGAAQAEIDAKQRVKDSIATIDEGEDRFAAVSGVDKLIADFGNETQALLNAQREREIKITQLKKISEDDRNKLLKASRMKHNADLLALEHQNLQTGLAMAGGFLGQLEVVLSQGGAKNSAVLKAIFLANKAIQVAMIISATEVAAANAAAIAALGGPVGFFATQGAIRATGYASAALVAGMAVGQTLSGSPGRVNGGFAPSGFATPVTENGRPELFQSAAGTFLLPGKAGGQVSPMQDAGGSGGSNISVTVIDNVGASVQVTSVGRDELEIILDRRQEDTVNQINTSLAAAEGDTYDALSRSTQINRNLR